jgi:MFS family permease
MVALPVGAMMMQQAFATMSSMALPVLAPPIIAHLGVGAGLIGPFVSLMYVVAMVTSLAAGAFILRFGALRLSQVCLLFSSMGLILAASGFMAAIVVAALFLGLGSGPSTPASSHILARFSPPRLAPLVFSIKQTGVPVGAMLAGSLMPFLAIRFGWPVALLAAAGLCLALAISLQPLRAGFDDDRQPRRPLGLRHIGATLRLVGRSRRLREAGLAMFVFTGLQMTFGSFLVAFLVDALDFTLTAAGLVFALGQAAGFVGRIMWGWVASRYVSARLLLGLLGLGMSAAGVAVGLFGPGWGTPAVALVSILFGLTGIGYQGLLLAETARHAPPGQVGVVTGGVVFFAYAGMVVFPALAGAIYGLTGAYGYGFFAAAALTLPTGIMFLRRPPASG